MFKPLTRKLNSLIPTRFSFRSKWPLSRLPLLFGEDASHGSYLFDVHDYKFYLNFANSKQMITYTRLIERNESRPKYIDSTVNQSDLHNKTKSNCITDFERFAMPNSFEYLYFADSNPVDLALKIAFDWKYKWIKENRGEYVDPQDLVIMHFTGASTKFSGYASSLSIENTNTPKFNWPRVPFPYLDSTLTDTNAFNFYERDKFARTKIEQYFSAYGDKIAAIIIEPVQCEAGVRFISGEFWRYLKYIADMNNVLLIADETHTGFGITGQVWSYQNYGKPDPDIVCFGKRTFVNGVMCSPKLSLIKDNLMEDQTKLPDTDSVTNMIEMTKLISAIKGGDLLNQYHTHNHMRAKMFELTRHDIISNVRGKGLLYGFDLPNRKIRDDVVHKAFVEQLLILPASENSIVIRPFLDVSRDAIDMLYEILHKILNNYKD